MFYSNIPIALLLAGVAVASIPFRSSSTELNESVVPCKADNDTVKIESKFHANASCNSKCKGTNETDKRYCRKFKAETKSHFSREQATTKQRKIHSFSLNNTTIYPAATCIKHWYTFDCLHSLLVFVVPFLCCLPLCALCSAAGAYVFMCVFDTLAIVVVGSPRSQSSYFIFVSFAAAVAASRSYFFRFLFHFPFYFFVSFFLVFLFWTKRGSRFTVLGLDKKNCE